MNLDFKSKPKYQIESREVYQENYKHEQVRFIPGIIHDMFIIQNSISVTHCINKLGNKKHLII